MSADTSISPLFAPLTLPNGQIIPNRIGKAAMEENMADPNQLPGATTIGTDRWKTAPDC